MKKITFLLLLTAATSFAVTPITENQRLYTTAKVWGFLKYYHPQVAKGKFDWDAQLFDFLDKTKNVRTKEELSGHYLSWIESLGTIKKCSACGKPSKKETFDKNFDLSWTQSEELFTLEVSAKLKYIENNRHRGPSHYAGRTQYVDSFNEQNETEYKDADWKDEHIRLLSLFRYWNQIEYFFPYKYMTDTKWDAVLSEMIPPFQSAASEVDYHLTMLRLTTKLDDSHAGFVSKLSNNYFGYYWAPAGFKIIDGKPIIHYLYDNELAAENDLRIGDIIEAVDGVPASEILAKQMRYIGGSNLPTQLRDTYYCLLNGQTDNVTITIERNGKRIEKPIKRYYRDKFKHFTPAEKPASKQLEEKIGYLDMGNLKYDVKEIENIMTELKKNDAIIIDCRNYPNGTMYQVARHLNGKEMEFGKFTRPDFDYPGKFFWTETYTAGPEKGTPYAGKIVILVNEETQSQAEFTVMILQTAPHVTTIGSQTAGADGNISWSTFPGGYPSGFSGLGIFYPDGTETQRKGIKVDLEVKPTIKGIREGRDEVLEKALELAR